MASAFQSQLLSLVAEGTFDRYPGLRVALLEAGFAWLPAFLWRVDKGWRGLRREMPWLTRAPSAYVREHVRVGLQPVDGPPDAGAARAGGRPARARRRCCMFATDWPHRHPRRPRVRARRPVARRWSDPVPQNAPMSHYKLRRDRRLRHPQRAGLRDALHAYLPEAWRRRRSAAGELAPEVRRCREKLGDRSYIGSEYPRATPRAARTDAWPPDGSPPASDLAVPARAAPGPLGRRVRRAEPAARRGRAARTWSRARRSRGRSTTGRPPSGSTRSRACARRSSSPTRTASCRRARDRAAAPTTRASCRCCMLIRTAEPLGRRKYWPMYGRRPSAACRSASTTAAGAAGR